MNGIKVPFIVLIIVLIIMALIIDALNWPQWVMYVLTGVVVIPFLFLWSRGK
jgi:Kef-type K+ transport system membrane component KefB